MSQRQEKWKAAGWVFNCCELKGYESVLCILKGCRGCRDAFMCHLKGNETSERLECLALIKNANYFSGQWPISWLVILALISTVCSRYSEGSTFLNRSSPKGITTSPPLCKSFQTCIPALITLHEQTPGALCVVTMETWHKSEYQQMLSEKS